MSSQRYWLVVEDNPIAGQDNPPYVRGPFGEAEAWTKLSLTDGARRGRVIPAATATEAAKIYEQRRREAA